MITLKHDGHKVEAIGPTTYRITKLCSIKKEPYSVEVHEEAYNKWMTGALIQNVMPLLSADQREFLISGLTPAEFEDLYRDDLSLDEGGDDGEED